jgi:signal transduction histidine kinase
MAATYERVDLTSPLPDEITGRTFGWLTRYRRYPVFSPAWARGRALTVGLFVALGTVLALGGAAMAAPDVPPWGAIVQVTLGVLVPLFAGPWLGSLVRRRGLAPRREWQALGALMLVLVLAVAAFNEWGSEPLKQRVAEWTGHVDEQGKRKRVALMIGVTVRSPDAPASSSASAASATATAAGASPASTAPDATESSPGDNIVSRLLIALATFTLAGGFALPRWRREHEGLAALAQERELARAESARREAEMRLSVLAAQVEPHFLFNTLAGVRSAIATDPARASEMIDRLTDYLRAAIPRLRSDGGTEATLGSQLEIVRAYLGLMKARMPRLHFTIDVPADLQRAHFPPLMLISLAENAVKHGAEPKIGPVRIDITARRVGEAQLQVTVADDGAGFGAAHTAGGGLGLANIRERLAQMYGERGALELRARPDGGVSASLTLPLA